MNYGEIKKFDIANGEGVRVSLFVSGCTHHCKGCFNEETWDFAYGKPFTEDTVTEIMDALSPEYINGLSLLGGEPFEKPNQRVLLSLLKKVKNKYPQKDIWCYTGYTLEKDIWCYTGDALEKDLLRDSRARCECTDEMLGYIDVLVDGEYVEGLKDISLPFRGSSNQRIIDVKSSIESSNVRMYRLKSEYKQ